MIRGAIIKLSKKEDLIQIINQNNVLSLLGGLKESIQPFRTIINPGDEVILLQPSYVAYTPGVALAGGVVRNITFNRRKAKDVTDKAVDKVADVTDKVKDIVTEKVGEENIEKVMDKVDEAKDKAMDAKDVFVEKVGEENIQMAKDKVKNVVNQAKDIVSEFVGKDDYEEVYTHDFNEDDFVDEDAVNEDVETEDDVRPW